MRRRWPRLRILAVTPYYEPEGGGLERYAHAVLSRLGRAGHDVEVACFAQNGAVSGERDGVRVSRLPPAVRLSNTPLDWRFPGRLRERIRRLSPDVVVGHGPVPFPAECAARAAAAEGVPFVLTYHAGRLLGGSPLLALAARAHAATLERRMFGRAARLVAVSRYVRDGVLASYASRTRVIPPGVDARAFRPSPLPDAPRILFAAPLANAYRWKGVDVLWEAFARVRRELPSARLTLVGGGDRLAEFRARAMCEDGAVEIRGRLSDEEYRRAVAEARVVALPSVTEAESFGMVLAEANACGRPVVGSRIGGIPCFVRDGENGLLARPGDPRDLAEKLLSLLRDRPLAERMGRAGRAIVEREHDWGALAIETQRVLVEAVDQDF
ncbi:MAG TPA: glycosyltransferase family 4 protein [Candidatus Thermoplasmatota archaeon]|nr:glycosyltransferase family 4 protein [Candidatus Thermoplasmatota archaeon]